MGGIFNISLLSNKELYVLSRNTSLDKDIRALVVEELQLRCIGPEEMTDMAEAYEGVFGDDNKEGLGLGYKLALLVLPPSFLILRLVFLWRTPHNQRRKHKEFYVFTCVGFMIWTFFAILIACLK